ncbi:MAG: hypothetical protein PHV39_02860 [Methanomicrobium sp.]|nr:hypothetical protein [Methanomicrobium sp.]
MEKMEKNEKSEKSRIDRRFVMTAVFGIAAIIIVLLAMALSGNTPDSGDVGLALVIILLLTVLTVIKTTKKKTVLYGGMIFGLLMAVAGIALSVIPELASQSDSFSAMTISGIIMSAVCAISLKKPVDHDLRDERALKIGTWAISYSWYLAFLSVIVMFWLSYLNVVALTVNAVLGILMLLMPLSAVLFQWYFSKKGDVY